MSLRPLIPSPAGPASTLAVPFSCTWSSGTNAAWVHLAGELDLANAHQLERTLSEAQRNTRLVVLDPRELTFIDCAGIHTIIEAAGRARREGGWLMLMVASPLVERLLALTGGNDLVTIFDVALDAHPLVPTAEVQPTRRWRRASPRTELGRYPELRAVRDSAEDAPPPSGVRATAWSRSTPGRGHATKPARPG